MNYRVNFGGRRGHETYHDNILLKYNRAAMFVHTDIGADEPTEMTSPYADSESIADIKLGRNLKPEEREQLRELSEQFQYGFTQKPGRTNLVEHNIRATT